MHYTDYHSVKFNPVKHQGSLYSFSKRTLDIVLSLSVIILLLPIFILTAIIIKLTTKGPIIYWQKRAGLNGAPMSFPKFRSMVDGADRIKHLIENSHAEGYTFKCKEDPRITPFGKIIRKFSIDELPQLFLVIKGDMTLVGPRPATLSEVAEYSEFQRQRLKVKPGLTCLWQVNGRADIAFHTQCKMDIQYINSMSFTFDLQLLIRTIPAVLSGKGAY